MRGFVEKQCLTIILNLLYGKATLINGTRVLDIKESDLPLDYPCMDHGQRFFGFSSEMCQEFENTMLYAMLSLQIDDNSKFPDFKSKNGFIEHFEITSSKETSKGSKDRSIRGEVTSQVCKNMITNNLPYELRGIPPIIHSYSWFVKSFKSNWEKHINSLNAYDGNKDVGVFLIDFRQNFLLMYCKQLDDIEWPDDVSTGDLWTSKSDDRWTSKSDDRYRLSRDKDLLKYVYQYKDKIKYVIFMFDNHNFEVISTQNIPLIIRLLPYSYSFIGITPEISMLTTLRLL